MNEQQAKAVKQMTEALNASGFHYDNLSTNQRLYGGSIGAGLVILLENALQQGLTAPLFMDVVDQNQVINEIRERGLLIPVDPTHIENLFAQLATKAWQNGAPTDSLLEEVFAELSA